MQLHRCWLSWQLLILEIYHLVPSQSHSGNQTWQWNMYEHVLFGSDFPIETSIGDFVLPPLIPAGYCYMVPVLSDLCLPDPSPSPTPTAPLPCHPQEQMCLLHVVDIYIWIIWVCATWNPSLNPQGSSIVMRLMRCLEQPFGFIPKPGLSRFSIFPKPPKSQRKPHDSSKLQLIRCRVTNKDVVSVTKGRLAVMGQMAMWVQWGKVWTRNSFICSWYGSKNQAPEQWTTLPCCRFSGVPGRRDVKPALDNINLSLAYLNTTRLAPRPPLKEGSSPATTGMAWWGTSSWASTIWNGCTSAEQSCWILWVDPAGKTTGHPHNCW